ncbi:DUF7210 family protein [Comamonas guangdongensis]|uniref:DUF7210 domain-containing protein n=1 Tax=Comamonas guangdongensis TaxID=510515 RepID=A0ABV3ZVR0_9BURK
MRPRTRKAMPAQPAMVLMTLTAEHEHLGEWLQPGAEVCVHPDTARWLEAMEVAVPAQPAIQPVNTKD